MAGSKSAEAAEGVYVWVGDCRGDTVACAWGGRGDAVGIPRAAF